MRCLYALLLLLFTYSAVAQCTFTSNSSAFAENDNWDEARNWTVVSGGCIQDTDYPGSASRTTDVVEITSSNDIDYNLNTNLDISTITFSGGNFTFTASGGDLDVNLDFNVTASSTIEASNIFATTPRMDMTNAVTITIDNGQTLTVGGIVFNSNGTMNVSGTIEFDSNSGTGGKNFDEVNILAGGTWDASAITRFFNFDDNITIAGTGTWNGCLTSTGCRYNFRQNLSVSGEGTFQVPDIRVYDGITFTNNGNIIVTDDIDGQSGSFATFVNNGTLELRDNGSYTELTYDLAAVGSLVRYSGGTNKVIDIGPFYNLEVNMDNSTVFCQVNGTDVSVLNDFTLTQGRFRLETANILDVDGNIIINGGEFEPNVVGNVINVGSALAPTNLVLNGGVFDFNNGTLNVSGDFNQTGGDLIQIQNPTINFLITGNYNLSGGTSDINSGTLSFIDMDITNGATINVASPTITSSGTITVDNGTYTINDANGTYNYNNITVNANGAWNVTAAYDPIISGSIINNGTFTGCNGIGCVYTFSNTTASVSEHLQ